ncbi:hypothetical protein AC578_10116, partial [Pseudocercospora eumusae]
LVKGVLNAVEGRSSNGAVTVGLVASLLRSLDDLGVNDTALSKVDESVDLLVIVLVELRLSAAQWLGREELRLALDGVESLVGLDESSALATGRVALTLEVAWVVLVDGADDVLDVGGVDVTLAGGTWDTAEGPCTESLLLGLSLSLTLAGGTWDTAEGPCTETLLGISISVTLASGTWDTAESPCTQSLLLLGLGVTGLKAAPGTPQKVHAPSLFLASGSASAKASAMASADRFRRWQAAPGTPQKVHAPRRFLASASASRLQAAPGTPQKVHAPRRFFGSALAIGSATAMAWTRGPAAKRRAAISNFMLRFVVLFLV